MPEAKACEEFEGFVPVIVLLSDQRGEGKAWKRGGRRLLQDIEERHRQFLPIVDAKVHSLTEPQSPPVLLPLVAVNTAAIRWIIAGDDISPATRRGRRS